MMWNTGASTLGVAWCLMLLMRPHLRLRTEPSIERTNTTTLHNQTQARRTGNAIRFENPQDIHSEILTILSPINRRYFDK